MSSALSESAASFSDPSHDFEPELEQIADVNVKSAGIRPIHA